MAIATCLLVREINSCSYVMCLVQYFYFSLNLNMMLCFLSFSWHVLWTNDGTEYPCRIGY